MSKNCLWSPLASISSYEGRWPRIAPDAFLADGARIIGDVTIGPRSSIWFNTVLRGDVFPITIGAQTNIQDGAVVHTTFRRHATHIGDNVTIGHLAMIHGCTIGNHCLIGMQAVVMDAAEIGEECIVGAGAVVTQGARIPPRSLVVGAPAQVKRTLSEAEIAAIRESAERYIEYTKGYNFEEGTISAPTFARAHPWTP